MRIAGGALSANQAGLTYQYIAVSDPGMRFMLGGSMAQRNTAGPSPYPLIDANFLGQFAFLWVDYAQASGSSIGLYARGPGSAPGVITSFNGIKVASALTINQGSLTTENGLFNLNPDASICYMLVRQDDGSGDAGMAGCARSAPTPATGPPADHQLPAERRPANLRDGLSRGRRAGGRWRDPSHTGTTSTDSGGG